MSAAQLTLLAIGTIVVIGVIYLAIREITGGSTAEAAVWLKAVIFLVILTVTLWLTIRTGLWFVIPVGGALFWLFCHKRKGKSNPSSKGGEGWIQKLLAWPMSAIKWLAVNALWSLAIGAAIAVILDTLGLATFNWPFAFIAGVGVRAVFKILKTVKAVAIAVAIAAGILALLG